MARITQVEVLNYNTRPGYKEVLIHGNDVPPNTLIYLAEQNIGTEWARNTSSPYGTFTINAGFRKIGQYLVVVTPLASDGKVGNNKNWSDPALLIVK